ncbi:MAG: acyl carrier protein [Caldilineaceae bacterium]|nr:acyl carrier protein [Caldilineaceae bacterium]
MKSKQDVLNQTRSFILDKFPLARQQTLADDDALLGSGIVDSLGILELVGFVEEAFGVTVDVEDLQPENFQSIDRIAIFVESKSFDEVVMIGE